MTDKKQVAMAIKQVISRIGVKSILSVIGMEPELFETNNLEILENEARKGYLEFIIIGTDLLPSNADRVLKNLHSKHPDFRIMIVGEDIENGCECASSVIGADDQKLVLEKFQKFFFEPDANAQRSTDQLLLSDREIDVLKEVAKGYTNKEIAERLFISINTVITHRKNITEKLGIKTIAGLTVYAIMNDLVDPDEAINQ